MSHCETDIPVTIPPATSFLNLIKAFLMTYKRINIHWWIPAKFVLNDNFVFYLRGRDKQIMFTLKKKNHTTSLKDYHGKMIQNMLETFFN